MFRVLIEGLDFYGYHGVPAEERAIGHRYLVDVELLVNGAADATDAISDTVDYAQVAQVVEGVVRDAQCHTVERLGALIAERLLASFALVESVSVTVRKPCPPMPYIAAAAGAVVTRRRG